MGGYNSGRRGWHVTVEAGLVLDLCHLIHTGSVVPGCHVRGTLTWTHTLTQEKVASIGYEADLSDPFASTIRLHYTITRDGKAISKDCKVWLEATQPHFGGKRWWFVCPVTGRRAGKLYLPPGANVFASRWAYPLAYQSQRDGGMDRTHARQRRIYAKLGVEYRFFEQGAPPRKKWMRRATYERLLEELEAAEMAHDLFFIAGAERFETRLARMQTNKL